MNDYENAIEIKGLTKRYDGFTLDNVSFDLERDIFGYIIAVWSCDLAEDISAVRKCQYDMLFTGRCPLLNDLTIRIDDLKHSAFEFLA